MIRKIAIDIQHIGKPQSPLDRGACSHEVNETDITLAYGVKLFQHLTKTGFEPYLLTHGTYKERHEWCNVHKMDLYLACHANSGGGEYSLIERIESEAPDDIAYSLAESIMKCIAEGLGFKTHIWVLTPDDRGYKCINGVNCPALLFEPLFIDNDIHRNIGLTLPYLFAFWITEAIKGVNQNEKS